MRWLECLIFSFSLLSVSGQYSKDFAGPFNTVVERFDQCDDTGSQWFYLQSIRISKISRYHYVYSTNVTLEKDFPYDASASCDMAIWGNGGWRPHAFQFDYDNFCETVKLYAPKILSRIGQITGRDIGNCTVKKGTFELKNFSIDDLTVNLPAFPYGKYRAEFSIKEDGKTFACARCYFQVIPKRKGH